jgi:hypothetical protein
MKNSLRDQPNYKSIEWYTCMICWKVMQEDKFAIVEAYCDICHDCLPEYRRIERLKNKRQVKILEENTDVTWMIGEESAKIIR